MAQLKETPFQAWEFTDGEFPQAVIFTDMQEKHIRTELATVMQEKMKLAYNPQIPEQFNLEHEYCRGKAEILEYLLRVSDDTRTELQRALEEQRQAQMDRNPNRNNNQS